MHRLCQAFGKGSTAGEVTLWGKEHTCVPWPCWPRTPDPAGAPGLGGAEMGGEAWSSLWEWNQQDTGAGREAQEPVSVLPVHPCLRGQSS